MIAWKNITYANAEYTESITAKFYSSQVFLSSFSMFMIDTDSK